MSTFNDLADEDWRIVIDDEISEPTICYPDPSRRGAYVGPLARVYVGCTIENEDGDECLELDGDDGRNLFAVACLPQFADLCKWIDARYGKLGVSENAEFNKFVDELKARVDWIREIIDTRTDEISEDSGPVGFVRFTGPTLRANK